MVFKWFFVSGVAQPIYNPLFSVNTCRTLQIVVGCVDYKTGWLLLNKLSHWISRLSVVRIVLNLRQQLKLYGKYTFISTSMNFLNELSITLFACVLTFNSINGWTIAPLKN